MFSTAEKTNNASTVVQQKAQRQPFFRKVEEETFFGSRDKTSFFSAPVQAKLSVSSPDDPQEKEADAVAESVMRMPEPEAQSIMKNEDEKIDKKEEEDELQAKLDVSGIHKVDRQEAEEEEEVQAKSNTSSILKLQRQNEEEEVQAKYISKIYRHTSESFESGKENFPDSSEIEYVDRKPINNNKSFTIYRSSRGPPGSTNSFEQNLASTKGAGTALPGDTRQFMESRFNADFSGIRVHTGEAAQNMSSDIHAHAFAHGRDIYFNEGKFAPQTSNGGLLLAHELTHTIQQGASPAKNTATASPKTISTKPKIQQSSTGVPENLTNTVDKAKSIGGIIDADKADNPKSRHGLRNELFNINRREEQDSEKNIQAKSNKENVSPSLFTEVKYNAATSIQTETEADELQKEETQEEENKVAAKFFDRNKHSGVGNTVNKEGFQYGSALISNTPFLQAEFNQNDGKLQVSLSNNTVSQSVEPNSRGPPVHEFTHENKIQGGWFDNAISFVNSAVDYVSEGLEAGKRLLLNEARDFVMAIPGYKALRVVLGKDPINGEIIDRNGHNFIQAAFDIMPGGNLLYDKLNELGALHEAEQWVDTGISAVKSLVDGVLSRVDRFWNNLSIDDLASPMQIFEDAGNIIHSTISEVVDFALSVATELLEIVKRWLLTQLVDFIKQHTTAYPLLTVILGKDPITNAPVDRNGTNILNAILELGGEEGALQRTQMQETGTFQKAADWIDQGIGVFGNLLETITQNFDLIWSVVSIDALMHPADKFTEIYQTFAQPISDVLAFMAETVKVILRMIKEVFLQRLSNWARGVRGYYLMTVIIGEDPFTNAQVERNVENIIHGFMGLMEGGEEQFQQMKEAGSIERASKRIEAAVNRLNMTVAFIIQLFINLWNSFSFNDFVQPFEAFGRIIATLGEPIARLIAFVVEIVKIVIIVLLEMMNFPFDLITNIINKSLSAFHSIKRDPIGFLKNILRAIKQGFIQFFDNIVTHLVNGVVGWLMSELRDAGIPILTDFSLKGVISWVLVVLGITMEKIWEKLAAHPKIGPERVAKLKGMIDTLEGIWTFIKDVQERGISAIWERIKEQLSNLWNVVLDAVRNWIITKIITQVTVKLLSLLDPTGIMAVINSCIAIYKAVQSFIRYLREMLEIVNSFVNGIADIAAGKISTAANYLENTMAKAMPIVIGFLANQVGLGGIGSKIGEMILRAREMVDNAIAWLVNKAVDVGSALLEKAMAVGKSAAEKVLGWLGIKKEFTADDGKQHKVYFKGTGENAVIYVESDPTPYTNFLNSYKEELGSEVNDEVTVNGVQKTKVQVIEDAKVVANNIETEKKKKIATYSGADDKAKEKSKADEIEKLLNALAELSKPLFGEAKDKPRDNDIIIPAGANNNQFSQSQEVNLIWKTPKVTGNGSGPDNNAKHSIYDKINFRKKGDGSYYVRGHLINDNIGGPGKWNNMTALSRTANHEHEEKVESKVKAAFDSGAVIRYKVTASGNQNVQKVTVADKDKFTKIGNFATALPYLEQITEAESNVPTMLACEAYTMKKKGDKWEDDKKIVTDTINFNIGSYGDYELGELGGTVTLSIAQLKTEAATTDFTYANFRDQDNIHKNSIKLLSALQVSELEQVFADKERENAKSEELKKISDMNTANDITTWNSFMGGRVFYKIKTDAAHSEVETAFNSTQTNLKNNAINAAKMKVQKASANAFQGQNWIDFKIAEKINFQANTANSTKISEVEATFRSKQ